MPVLYTDRCPIGLLQKFNSDAMMPLLDCKHKHLSHQRKEKMSKRQRTKAITRKDASG